MIRNFFSSTITPITSLDPAATLQEVGACAESSCERLQGSRGPALRQSDAHSRGPANREHAPEQLGLGLVPSGGRRDWGWGAAVWEAGTVLFPDLVLGCSGQPFSKCPWALVLLSITVTNI